MALRQLMLNRRKKELNAKLEELRAKDTEFTTRSESMKTREAELEAAVNEITEASTDEERAAVDEAVASFEADQESLATEQSENEEAKSKLEGEIAELQKELDELDQRSKTPPAGSTGEKRKKENGGEVRMRGTGFFRNMEAEQRSAFLANTEVKDFLSRVREFKGQQRAVSGTDLLIPEVVLDLLRDNLHRYSKLITKVRLKPVNGKARQNVAGTIPEGIWMEAVGALNELALSFNQVEVDGYKVGGFVPIPNSTLEDSDLNLANEILDALGQAIGYAIDKAILFGTGTKMPIGIATRLAQTAKPASWDDNAPAWTDLHASNLLKIDPAGKTAEEFFAAFMLLLSVAKPNYSSGAKFWVMNSITYATLLSKTLKFNAAGALVASLNQTMPIIGGDVIILEFVADNDIIGGFGSLYLLAERAGSQLAVSEHARFIEDQTVFKGTARYDGKPVFGEGFVMVNIANSAPTTSVLFAQDVANTVATPKALPIAGEYSGAQEVSLTCDTVGATIYYTTDGSTPDATKTAYNGPIDVTADTTIKAIAIKSGLTNSAVLTAAYTITA
ncbi:phage major capsid protein [Desulfosporosinus sp.]|uniref:phage major capsid protein n=1 Tax=Desulfosporosinus sp. TaxID=157907 RepID=UPI0025BE6EAD|nr:phage major capsid protein [Desulfosporosinus sp.]MBC2721833.1 phage major capsid protein [Desulfosporosinus sp.]MBC2726263.1 phage major capsid protein [Desulfosporosinus sp.]